LTTGPDTPPSSAGRLKAAILRLIEIPRGLTSLSSQLVLMSDGLARLEQDGAQRHAATQTVLQALADRLDRTEAEQLEQRDRITRLHDGVVSLQAHAAMAGMDTVRPARPLFTDSEMQAAKLVRHLGERLPPALVTFLDAARDLPLLVQDDTHLPGASEAGRTFALAAANRDRRAVIDAGTRLVWLLPPASEDGAAMADELEQALGILATDVTVHAGVGTPERTIVTGIRKAESAMPVLVWDGLGASFAAASQTAAALTVATRQRIRPALRLPALADQAADDWADAAVSHLVTCLGSLHATEWGVAWPAAALDADETFMPALDALRAALSRHGLSLAFQWVEGHVTIARTAAIHRLARRAGVRLDLTPTARDVGAGLMTAYDAVAPYRPAGFDLRIPAFAAVVPGTSPLICMARRDTALDIAGSDPFEAWTCDVARRLDQVFDRQARRRFSAWLDAGNSQAGQWEQFHVYNWRPPVDALSVVPVIDANGQASDSFLRVLSEGLDRFRPIAPADIVASGSAGGLDPASDNLTLQIDAHDYLVGRLEPSADSARLMDWFPAAMGDTLEIGSGYGVLARRFMDRTTQYVGVDLTLAQGRAIADLGGHPLVADIHALPFPDGAFDTIIADNVIEHALEPLKALGEIRRLLRPGGKAYLLLPLDYLGKAYRNPSHLWKADLHSIRSALGQSGLAILRADTAVYAHLGGDGSFPSCQNTTSYWEVCSLDHADDTGARDDGSVVRPDLLADILGVDPDLGAITHQAGEDVVALNATSDLEPLARNSPALRNFNWSFYIRFSGARIVRSLKALRQRKVSGTVLDMGSYFGNFSLALKRAGWQPVALDSYRTYGHAFDQHRARMEAEGIDIRDYDDIGYDLSGFADESFDAIICMGVIEHIPHTPRMLLDSIRRVLKPGGVAILDTPNLGYEYQRQKLMRGQTVFAPIETQFETDIPFEGHHREYLPEEMRWMLTRAGFEAVDIEMFNYSVYGFTELTGEHLVRFRAMERDPNRREIILAVAAKPQR